MNKHFKRNLAAGAACAVGLGLIALPSTAFATGTDDAGAAPAAPAAGTVNILHFNDFHGRLQANRADDGTYSAGATVQFAGTIEQLRAEHGDDASLVLSGGDTIGASLYASASQQDTPSLEVLNALDVAASAAGNHEFDRGIADLQDRVRDIADFPYLAANVTLNGTPIDDGYATFEVNGVQVAVIGAVTQESPTLVDPSGITGVEFGDPVAAVNAIAATLSDGNEANGEADIIIAEYHEGAQTTLAPNAPQEEQTVALEAAMAESDAFRSIVEDTAPAVDLVFNGHTQGTYTWLAPAPEGSPNDVRPIVQAGQYAEQVAQVVASFDAASGEVTFETVQNVARTGAAPADLVAAYPRVAAVDEITNTALEQADVIGGEPLGEITADITTAFSGDSRDDRGSASTMGTLVGNMLRDQLAAESRGGAEIGITNPGGLRDEFYFDGDAEDGSEDGVVTVGEAAAVLPFANNLWTTTLTGEQLKVVLEQQWQRTADGEVPSRAYLQLGLSDNVRYTYDATLEEGSRITSIWVDGELVTADDTFRVAAPSFLISGGDNFRGFTAGTDARDSGLVDSEAFQAYIEGESPLSPDFARAQVEVVSLPTEPVAPGAEIAFTVNKIDLTSLGAPVSEEISLYLDDELLGSFPVVADSAEVSFTMPFVTEGRFELRTESGTAIALPIESALAVDRIAGVNRYETAVAISQSGYAEGADVVYVASGQVWPDALTGAPAAANEGGPLLLVREGEAPQVVLDEIERLGAERVVIVGGLPSVGADVEAAIDEISTVTTIDRLGGANRYETSRLVAEYAFESAEGAYVVTGKRFPDALSAGAAAGHVAWPLVLVNTSIEVPAETVALLNGLGADRVRIVGSADAVPGAIGGQLVDAGFSVLRQGGVDRYETSAIVTSAVFGDAADGAYLANGVLFPDALAGGAVAAAEGSPLLISRQACVPQSVLDELQRLQASDITLLGGEPSLGQEVAALESCG